MAGDASIRNCTAMRRIRTLCRLATALAAAALACAGCGKREPVRETTGPLPPPPPPRRTARIVESARLAVPKARSVVFVGNRAFIAQNLEGMSVADTTNIARPRITARIPPTVIQPLHLVDAGQGLLAAADRFRGLVMLDVSKPDFPTTVSSVAVPGIATRVSLFSRNGGRYVAVASGGAGLTTVDITDPRSPRRAGHWNTHTDYSRSVLTLMPARDKQGHPAWAEPSPESSSPAPLAWIADNLDGGLKVLDLGNPEAPELLLKVSLPGYCDSLHMSGDLLACAYRNRGTRLFRVLPGAPATDHATTPSVEFLAGVHRSGNRVQDAITFRIGAGGKDDWPVLAVADDRAGIALYDLSDPRVPLLAGEAATPDAAISCVWHAAHLVASCWDGGVVVYKVSPK